MTFYFAPDQSAGPDPVRRLRLPARHATARCRPRSGAPTTRAVAPGPGGRAAGARPRRAGHRPVQGHARRAVRPGQGPLRRRQARRGRRAARGAVRRLHPARRHRQGRRADAPARSTSRTTARARSSSTSRSSRRRPPSWSSRSTSCSSSAGPIAISASSSGPTSSGAGSSRRATWRTPASARCSASAARRSKAIAYLLDLWREYPNTASIESDFFGLSQVLARHAGQAITDPALRHELADGRRHPLGAAPPVDPADPGRSSRSRPRTRWPTRRAWPWWARSSSWRTTRPSSSSRRGSRSSIPRARSSTASSTARRLGEFHLGHYDRAVEVAETIAKATYKDANGVDQPSPNKWQALYILGQIYDARRQPGKALEVLRAGRRPVHATRPGAIKALTRKDLKLPEVTVRPARAAKVARGSRRGPPASRPARREARRRQARGDARLPQHRRGRREGLPGRPDAAVPDPPQPRRRSPGSTWPGSRRCSRRRSSSATATDFADKVRTIDLPLKKEGAYLVMVRGDEPVRLGDRAGDAAGDGGPGGARQRPGARDGPRRRDQGPRAQGPGQGDRQRQPDFLSGETDLRGVFVAEGVTRPGDGRRPQGAAQYAFYRGTSLRRCGPHASRAFERRHATGPARSRPPRPRCSTRTSGHQHFQPDAADRAARTARWRRPQEGGAAAGGFK